MLQLSQYLQIFLSTQLIICTVYYEHDLVAIGLALMLLTVSLWLLLRQYYFTALFGTIVAISICNADSHINLARLFGMTVISFYQLEVQEHHRASQLYYWLLTGLTYLVVGVNTKIVSTIMLYTVIMIHMLEYCKLLPFGL